MTDAGTSKSGQITQRPNATENTRCPRSQKEGRRLSNNDDRAASSTLKRTRIDTEVDKPSSLENEVEREEEETIKTVAQKGSQTNGDERDSTADDVPAGPTTVTIMGMEMAVGNNYYDVLGCDPSASMDQIKAEYKAKVRLQHPDKNKQGAAAFDELATAYRVLSDPEQRQEYDKWRCSGIAIPYDQWMKTDEAKRGSFHFQASKRKPTLALKENEVEAVDVVSSEVVYGGHFTSAQSRHSQQFRHWW